MSLDHSNIGDRVRLPLVDFRVGRTQSVQFLCQFWPYKVYGPNSESAVFILRSCAHWISPFLSLSLLPWCCCLIIGKDPLLPRSALSFGVRAPTWATFSDACKGEQFEFQVRASGQLRLLFILRPRATSFGFSTSRVGRGQQRNVQTPYLRQLKTMQSMLELFIPAALCDSPEGARSRRFRGRTICMRMGSLGASQVQLPVR